MVGTFDGFEEPTLLEVCSDPILAIQEPNHSHTHGRWIDRVGERLAAFDADDFLSHCSELANRQPRWSMQQLRGSGKDSEWSAGAEKLRKSRNRNNLDPT